MKRIKAACIQQTLHFLLKEDADRDLAASAVQDEVRRYKQQLERGHVQHKILSEGTLEDGSVLIKIIKQYNTSSVGDYLN